MRVLRGAGGVRMPLPMETDARRRAEGLVQAATIQAESVRAQARAQGLAEGRAEAVALRVQALDAMAKWERGQTGAVVDLACAVAGSVLGRQAVASTEMVQDIAVGVLVRAARARRVTLRVHPEDLAGVMAQVDVWASQGLVTGVLAVEADPDVTRGGVVADTDIGRIDGRLEVQLAACARVLADQAPPR